jgi:hypothetical protein
MAFPSEPARIDYDTNNPYLDDNGKEWTWNPALVRWEPYLNVAPLVHAHVLADITDAGTATEFDYTQADTAPATPADGDKWLDTTTGIEYVRYDGQWITDTPSNTWNGDIADIDIAGGAEIAVDLADGDLLVVHDISGTPANKTSFLSRVWTYIKAKIDAGQTWAGVHAFSSTTRPTSGGTGTPDATSLITRDDGDTRYGGPLYTGRATSDQTVTNQTTPFVASTNGCSVTVPAGTYFVQFYFFYTCDTAAGVKTQLKTSSNFTNLVGIENIGVSNGSVTSSFGNSAGPANIIGFRQATSGTSYNHVFSGYLTFAASATLTGEFANYAASGNSILKAGSSIYARKIA